MPVLNKLQAPLTRLQCLSGNQMKLLAAAFMLVDHVSKIVVIALLSDILIPMETAGYIATCIY